MAKETLKRERCEKIDFEKNIMVRELLHNTAHIILFAFILLPYFRIRRISQKIEDKDVDENYFIFKSPLAFTGKIFKQVFGF